MSSGDMYSEPSYDDVAQEVRSETTSTPVAPPKSSDSDITGCACLIGALLVILVLYLALR